ncbi:MAG: heavy-metal-associated domain-containing protein [Nitrococcus sp.]|nr:heavy-metal-associated domain-containing protein [Nitrococcus sp.]
MERYVHHIPGRIRIKCAGIRGNAERAFALQALLRNRPGVAETTVNTVTGSVLIKFEPGETSAQELFTSVRLAGFDTWPVPSMLTPAGAQRMVPFSNKRFRRTGMKLGKIAAGMLLEKALERSALALIGAIL